MKKSLKSYMLGFLSAAILTSGVTYAANMTTLYDVVANGIKIFVDGHEIKPTDANGKSVEPFIYNGTTYLPVRAVADALGKPVYWDGPNFTVYLGEMNGSLAYPTKELSLDDNIGGNWRKSDRLKDNYGNRYSRAITSWGDDTYEMLCNMKYSSFKGTIYVAEGCSDNGTAQVIVKTDGKTVYTSPEIDKTTGPIDFDIDITGCNDLQINMTNNFGDYYNGEILIGDAGLYQ